MTPELQKKIVLQLAGLTMVGMPLIAYIIDQFSESLSMSDRLMSGKNIWLQLGVGIVAGVVFGAIAQWIVDRKFMQAVNIKYTQMIGQLQLNWKEILFISLCAGVGEEILFRGALQFFFGIIATAIVFVAIHGYLSIKDWRITVYGLYMTFAIIVLGFLTEWIGIWSAVMAHIVIDIYLLLNLKLENIVVPEDSDISDHSDNNFSEPTDEEKEP
jgi:membrane protease YdiL (CAAX protease family)